MIATVPITQKLPRKILLLPDVCFYLEENCVARMKPYLVGTTDTASGRLQRTLEHGFSKRILPSCLNGDTVLQQAAKLNASSPIQSLETQNSANYSLM
jgi:hypothetical protein